MQTCKEDTLGGSVWREVFVKSPLTWVRLEGGN